MAALAAVFILAFTTGARAQIPEGPVVRSIDVQFVGPASVSEERVLANMKTTVGQPYNEQFVEEDIRTLFNTNEVNNVRIFSEPAGDAVRVIVVLQTRATVSEVVLQGVNNLKAGRLRKEITTTPGATLSEETLEKDRQAIVAYYQSRGFSNVNVQYNLDVDEERGTAKIVFSIDEGGKAIIRKVLFEGNISIPAKELNGVMKTKGRNWLAWINKSGRLEDSQLDTDILSIEEFYAGKGYIDARVTDVRRERVSDNRIDLVIDISEGPQYTLGNLAVAGNELFTTDEIISKLSMVEGSVYSPQGLREDSQTISDMYGSRGYVDLLLIPESAAAGDSVVDLTYKIDEGYQSYVEQIDISGNTRTKDKVIRRELAIIPGDIYDTTAVETSKRRLENLGYFSRVETYPNPTMIPGRKDLNIVVQEQRTGSFNFGAGFSSIDNLIGFVELTQGNFDIAGWPSFTGAGQKFRTRIQFGTERKDFIIGLTEPWFLDKKLSLGGELFYRESNFFSDVYDQRNIGGALTMRQPVGNFSSLQYEYRLEEIEVFDVEDGASDIIKEEEGTRIKSQLGVLYTYDTRDSVFLTRKGERVMFNVYGAGGPLGGETDIYGFGLEATKYWSLPLDGIFFIEGEIAVVDTWNGGDRVPIWDRLYLGGANNLRGFDFREVGPKDEDGEPIGGKTLARMTAEYTFPLITKVRGAVFYDVGFVSADSYDWNTDGLGSDVGIGLRMDLPIGPVRIDFGYPIQSDESNDSSGKFNFNVGYQF